MIVKATEIKNNFGKYLKLLDKEDIVITKNGNPVARITSHTDWDDSGIVREKAEEYRYNGMKMSYEDFLALFNDSDQRYEYIDGEVFLIASPKITHQHVLGNLYTLLRAWFKDKKCMPYMSPFDVTLKKSNTDVSVVQPDLLVICDPENRNENDTYTGIPTLVVEIMSDTTAKIDLVKKLDLYMQSGIQEYWIVNYFNKEVIVYSFKNKDIEEMKLYVRDDTVESFIFKGLAINMNEVFG